MIDAHAHVLPRDFPERTDFPAMEVIAGDSARLLSFGATRYRAREVFFAAERRLEALDEAGVDEEIISPMPPLLNYTLDRQVGLSLARHVNEATAQFVAAGSGRIHGLGIVPMQDPAAAAAELHSVLDLGLHGVEVASHVNGVAIGDERFAEFFDEVDRLNAAVFIHALPRADEASLAPVLRGSIGVGIEGARGAASLILGERAQENRLERVLFSHAAGGLPLMLARADHFWANQDQSTRTPEPPSELARRFSYDSMVFDPRGLRFVIDFLGADRIMLGSDYPAMDRRMPFAGILDDLDLPVSDRESIATANARRFLGLGTGLPVSAHAAAAS